MAARWKWEAGGVLRPSIGAATWNGDNQTVRLLRQAELQWVLLSQVWPTTNSDRNSECRLVPPPVCPFYQPAEPISGNPERSAEARPRKGIRPRVACSEGQEGSEATSPRNEAASYEEHSDSEEEIINDDNYFYVCELLGNISLNPSSRLSMTVGKSFIVSKSRAGAEHKMGI